MRAFRKSVPSAVVATAAVLVLWPGVAPSVNAQTDKSAPLTGAWILNTDLSDNSQNQTGEGREGGARGRRSGGGRGFGRGGFGGAGSRGGRSGSDPEQAVRIRNAMRDLLRPSDRLTIVQTGSLIIITGSDGRTTRLSPDGKKVKDESTKFEWKTRWDGAKLVTEITGLPSGKILETYAVDPEQRQLHLALQFEDTRRAAAINRVYDFDAR